MGRSPRSPDSSQPKLPTTNPAYTQRVRHIAKFGGQASRVLAGCLGPAFTAFSFQRPLLSITRSNLHPPLHSPSHEWMDRVTAHIVRCAREARLCGSSTNNFDTRFKDGAGRQFEGKRHFNGGWFEHSPAHTAFEHSHSLARAAFEHSPTASGTSTPNPNGVGGGLYARALQQQQQHPPQRPAIITALSLLHHSAGAEYAPVHGHGHGGYAGLDAHGRAFPLSSSGVPDGRQYRCRQARWAARVDGREGVGGSFGPGMWEGGGAHRPGSAHKALSEPGSVHTVFRDGSFLVDPGQGPPSSGARLHAHTAPYLRGASPGSGTEAELDIDEGAEDAGRGGTDGDGGFSGAVGQMSLNEDKQVRKVSGLHFLARRAPVGEGSGHHVHAGGDEEVRGCDFNGNGFARAEHLAPAYSFHVELPTKPERRLGRPPWSDFPTPLGKESAATPAHEGE
ncbi:hypothetical protein B0H13DRAFT_2393354 [Mycena leptocephala]|nr:hypothetical protein B0H13DRAFT_2393354 [Mycena leptocephala]